MPAVQTRSITDTEGIHVFDLIIPEGTTPAATTKYVQRVHAAVMAYAESKKPVKKPKVPAAVAPEPAAVVKAKDPAKATKAAKAAAGGDAGKLTKLKLVDATVKQEKKAK